MLPDLVFRRPLGASPVPQSLLRGRTGGYLGGSTMRARRSSPCAHLSTECSAAEEVVAGSIKPEPEAARQRRRYERMQRQLDEALADTFPASDPVAIVTPQGEDDWLEEA